MTQATNYKRSFAGSVATGMKSVFGSSGRRFYELEHRTSSEKHHSGEVQKIIIDQIELGRDKNCQVHFGEDCKTVSRRHAAIVKDGNGWKLVQLSKTNSTYLNGRKIATDWYLQNGDEIQLSTGGPRLGFIVKEGAGSLVKSINLTARLSLFRQQALKPYKRALAGVAAVLVLVTTLGIYAINALNQENKRLMADAKTMQNQLDATKHQLEDHERSLDEKDSIINNLDQKIKKIKSQGGGGRAMPNPSPVSFNNDEINKCIPYIYYMEILGYKITMPDGSVTEVSVGQEYDSGKKVPGASGTGFLLSDGRFVTAHHVVEPWEFFGYGSINEFMLMLNVYQHNGGKVVAIIAAVSSSGDQQRFESGQFRCDRSSGYQERQLESGLTVCLAPLGTTDYAYYRLNKSYGLSYDATASNNLERGTKLTILGFPLGMGVTTKGISPILGNAIVANPGLYEGTILTTDRNFEHGNSGGPVFYEDKDGRLIVIGIVSGGTGDNLGFINPISAIH